MIAAQPAPPPPRPAAVPNNVPLALSSFVGRVREHHALGEALASARLVTVTGAGGAGKTRLVREVAARFAGVDPTAAADGGDAGAAPRFPDGVWWLELAPVADGAQVPQAAAAVLGVRATPGRDVTDAVAEALHGRRALLVLDNCEHVVEAAAAFAEQVLRAAPALTVLATSREALAVEGESAWVLPPLGTPGADGARGAEALLGYDAVRLFVERAQAASPAFALTDANAAAVAAIAARLDGLPLALELAAAAVPALGVEQVAARLDDVFALLTRGRRTALPRHRTLRALLDWSYALLGAEERTLLGRLAVFRGPFTLDAAEAVGGDRPGAPDAPDGALAVGGVVGALGRLVEHSLVDVREHDGETRYRLLETVRQYGLARLAEHPGAECAARARHAAWVDAHTAAAEPLTWSAARGRTIRRLERDVDEIRAALDWASGPGGDPMLAVRVAGALAWFWFSGVPWDEARRLTGAAVAAADAQGVPDAARPPAEQVALAVLGYPHAGMAYFAGDADTMLARCERALALWDRVDAARRADPAFDAAHRRAAVRGRSVIAQLVGLGRAMQGQPEPALAAMDASVAAARDGGEAWTHAVMLMRRALACALLRRPDEALADYTAALPLLRAVGETWFLSLALEGMAVVELARGDAAAAAAHARESVTALGAEADAWFVSRSLDTLAQIAASPAPGVAPSPARAVTAARLAGAAAALRSRCGAEIVGHDRARHAAMLEAVRAVAGPAFDAAWAEGEALALPGAMALAAEADVADPADARRPAASAPRRGATLPTPARTVVAVAAVATAEPPPPPADAPALLVEALGTPAVARYGVPIPAGELPAGKTTELLLLLVARPDGVTKEQAGLALWPDASAAQVRNAFHVTLHHLRRALGTVERAADRGAATPWVVFADGRYRLLREAVPGSGLDCDLDAVLAAADALRRAERAGTALDAEALAALGRALDRRLRGEFGEGAGAGDWALEVQDAVRTAWTDGTQLLARQHARAGRHGEAAAVLEALVARDPLREGAHRELMVLLAASGERARALRHYEQFAAALRREVDAEPARETRALAEQLRRMA